MSQKKEKNPGCQTGLSPRVEYPRIAAWGEFVLQEDPEKEKSDDDGDPDYFPDEEWGPEEEEDLLWPNRRKGFYK